MRKLRAFSHIALLIFAISAFGYPIDGLRGPNLKPQEKTNKKLSNQSEKQQNSKVPLEIKGTVVFTKYFIKPPSSRLDALALLGPFTIVEIHLDEEVCLSDRPTELLQFYPVGNHSDLLTREVRVKFTKYIRCQNGKIYPDGSKWTVRYPKKNN